MIVAGAARHAKEVLQILRENNCKIDYLFDNYSDNFHSYFDEFTIIKDFNDSRINAEDSFVLGLGGTINRKTLFESFVNLGLIAKNVVSNTAVIGESCVQLGSGLNIMHFSFIAEAVKIGNGTLINTYASIHHDVVIGNFTEISPKVAVLGGVSIGDLTSIGAGAIILPDVKIGNNCIIFAGSVVTKDVNDNEIWYGIPAKFMNKRI